MPCVNELGWVLVGVALARGADRDRVLASVKDGQLSDDVTRLLKAVRDKDAGVVYAWLKSRGIVVEKGQDVLQAMLDWVRDQRRLELVRQQAIEIGFSAKLEGIEEVEGRVRALLKTLEQCDE